jgi:hypothetical protein
MDQSRSAVSQVRSRGKERGGDRWRRGGDR